MGSDNVEVLIDTSLDDFPPKTVVSKPKRRLTNDYETQDELKRARIEVLHRAAAALEELTKYLANKNNNNKN